MAMAGLNMKCEVSHDCIKVEAQIMYDFCYSTMESFQNIVMITKFLNIISGGLGK